MNRRWRERLTTASLFILALAAILATILITGYHHGG